MKKDCKCSPIDAAAWGLLVVGGLNWGLVGVADLNLVENLLGQWPIVVQVVYCAVGASAVYCAFKQFAK